MRKNNLNKTGLSLSQAQSISNLCNQKAMDITIRLSSVNNCSKVITVDGKDLVTSTGNALPKNVLELLKEKSKLHACQAFLMENMKAKEATLNAIRYQTADLSSLVRPITPEFTRVVVIPEVDEEFGWEKLTAVELNEYREAEAYASSIGKFIHDKGVLAQLREKLSDIPEIEWMVVKGDGTKTPIQITKHHTPEQLIALHEDLAQVHRAYEQKVNYFKSKVKNLTTLENARIAKVNAQEQAEVSARNNELTSAYKSELSIYEEARKVLSTEFEQTRQDEIKRVAALKIEIDPRFQETIDFFIDRLPAAKD